MCQYAVLFSKTSHHRELNTQLEAANQMDFLPGIVGLCVCEYCIYGCVLTLKYICA